MFTNNPFAELSILISPGVMQTFVWVMILLVVGGTLFDVIHKKSAKYFFANYNQSKSKGARLTGGTLAAVAVQTAVHDVAASGEFCSKNRRFAHLLGMYGFIVFVVTTFKLIFSEPIVAAGGFTALLWHLGALMVVAGGVWFWFGFRADVVAEGRSPWRVMRADLFVLSLVAMTALALLWSFFQALGVVSLARLFLVLFVLATVVLFGGVPWSKFSHMFFKPAAAFEKRMSEANGSRNNLPAPADAPARFGLGIKREPPRHY